jgi:glycerol-3-phosphate dehydrogenase subunit B
VRRTLHYDAVVIGAGVAGLTAAARLAESGARVCVLAKGVGSTHLAPGTVDVLGYEPDGSEPARRVDSPARALPSFVAARPNHPYALVGVDAIRSALDWFVERIAHGPQPGYRYVGDLERNHLLPTAVGAARPSALVPETMAAGDLRAAGAVCVVGLHPLRDLHASLCAANIARSGVEARAVVVRLDVDRPDENALGLARRFEDVGFRRTFVDRLAPQLRDEERVALPAVLGVRDPHGTWSDLETRLGHPVFEIPTLPPSVPGIRVSDALRAALRVAGGRLVVGAEVVGGEHDGERVTAVHAHTAGGDTTYAARWVVLATGGFGSGALALGSDWVVRETVLGLPVRGAPSPGAARFVPDYFDEQPMSRVGVAVDANQRSEGLENVIVAGAALPGAEPWREGSGEGIAITSGHRAAELVRAEEGLVAAA